MEYKGSQSPDKITVPKIAHELKLYSKMRKFLVGSLKLGFNVRQSEY